MDGLKPNQILLEISENKKEVTVSCGAFWQPITYSACPARVTENLGNAIDTYVKQTGLNNITQWTNEKCGQLCRDCN